MKLPQTRLCGLKIFIVCNLQNENTKCLGLIGLLEIYFEELSAVVEKEGIEGIKFKIVETGTRSFQSEVQKSNPTQTKGCVNVDYSMQ